MYSKMRSYLIKSLIIMMFLSAAPLTLTAAETQEQVEYETGFYYTVQKGDTLWDLSRKFSDTPWQWPDMWKENEQIANPHRIYPGERIRLYRRRGAAAGETGESHETGKSRETGESGESHESDVKQEVTDKPKLEGRLHYDYTAIDRIGFIRKEPVLSRGTIFKVEGQKAMISSGDLVYIKPRANFSLTPGDRYTLYRTLKPILDIKTNQFIGIQHYLTGAVEIVLKRPEFVLGRIVAAYRPIKVGDLMMPYHRRVPQIAIHPSPEGLEGTIIDSEEHEGIFGENAIAFIDKGRSSGVETGQFYWIFKQEKYRIDPDDKNAVTLTPVVLGELLVLHTENTTSTVMITDSRQAIQAGARIIAPFKLE
ncbi:MAG: LysM domain-containing protein [Desulfobacterales bacterium]|nr:LysM domain-containing protein [Desulfobacterales bacterium]